MSIIKCSQFNSIYVKGWVRYSEPSSELSEQSMIPFRSGSKASVQCYTVLFFFRFPVRYPWQLNLCEYTVQELLSFHHNTSLTVFRETSCLNLKRGKKNIAKHTALLPELKQHKRNVRTSNETNIPRELQASNKTIEGLTWHSSSWFHYKNGHRGSWPELH